MSRSRKPAKPRVAADAATLAAHVQGQFEAEKARIARRLHGDVTGLLVAARMDLARMAGMAGVDPELRERLAHLDQTLTSAIQSARAEVERLHPALLDHFGLAVALRHLVAEACRAPGTLYELEFPDCVDHGLPGEVALAAYRVVEAMLGRCPPTRVSLRLRVVSSRLLLWVRVDCATAVATTEPSSLLALRAWLEALGGAWLESDRSGATEVELELPRLAASAAATPALVQALAP